MRKIIGIYVTLSNLDVNCKVIRGGGIDKIKYPVQHERE